MADTELIIPPHSLWLTAVEEDNRNIRMVARNKSDEDVTFTFSVIGPEGVEVRCIEDDSAFSSERCTYEVTVEPEHQSPAEFFLIYTDDVHREDANVVGKITDGSRTLRREFETKLFEN